MRKPASESARRWNGYRQVGPLVKKMPEKPALWCTRCEEPHDPELHLDRWSFDKGGHPRMSRTDAILRNMF